MIFCSAAPVAPSSTQEFLSSNTTCISVDLSVWKTGGCSISTFVLHYRLNGDSDWTNPGSRWVNYLGTISFTGLLLAVQCTSSAFEKCLRTKCASFFEVLMKHKITTDDCNSRETAVGANIDAEIRLRNSAHSRKVEEHTGTHTRIHNQVLTQPRRRTRNASLLALGLVFPLGSRWPLPGRILLRDRFAVPTRCSRRAPASTEIEDF